MESDLESRSSRCSSLRNRDTSSAGSRASSTGSNTSLEWFQLVEFHEVTEADKFVANSLPPNSTRDSKKQICIFFDKLTEQKHMMLLQIRHCRCSDECTVQYKYKKCSICNQGRIDQLEQDHLPSVKDVDKFKRGIPK